MNAMYARGLAYGILRSCHGAEKAVICAVTRLRPSVQRGWPCAHSIIALRLTFDDLSFPLPAHSPASPTCLHNHAPSNDNHPVHLSYQYTVRPHSCGGRGRGPTSPEFPKPRGERGFCEAWDLLDDNTKPNRRFSLPSASPLHRGWEGVEEAPMKTPIVKVLPNPVPALAPRTNLPACVRTA